MKLKEEEKEICRIDRVAARTQFIAYIKVADEQNANLVLTNKRLAFLSRDIVTGKEGIIRKEIWVKDIEDVQKTSAYYITPSIRINYREEGKIKNTEITLNPELLNWKHMIRLGIGVRKDERNKLYNSLIELIK